MEQKKVLSSTSVLAIIFILSYFSIAIDAIQNSIETEKLFKNPIHELMYAKLIENKQPKSAFKILSGLTKKNKRYAYKWLINLLHKNGMHNKIIEIIPILTKKFPQLLQNDPGTGFIVAYSLTKQYIPINGKLVGIRYNPKAMDLLIPLVNKFPADQKIASLAATLYDLNNEPQNALSVSEKYLNISATKPTDYLEFFKNSSRYLKLKNKVKALESIKKCVEIQPRFVPGLIKSVKLSEQLGKIDDAIKYCLDILELSGPNRCVIGNLLRLFFKQKKIQHKTSKFQIDSTCYKDAQNLFGQKKYKQALKHLDKCLSEKYQKNNILQKPINILIPSSKNMSKNPLDKFLLGNSFDTRKILY